jgi:EXS family
MKAQKENEIYQRFWMVLFVSSSLYSFSWDVFMDWGLGDRHHGYLAKSLMYQKRGIYYVIIAIDLVLRFAWVLTLIPPSSGAKFALPAYLSLVSMMLELFRRTLWGFLRLEHEHRSNASGYRRVDFVPLHFATGHNHGYKKEVTRSGFSVLAEVLLFASIVVCAAIVSVVAAQHASEQHSEF